MVENERFYQTAISKLGNFENFKIKLRNNQRKNIILKILGSFLNFQGKNGRYVKEPRQVWEVF